MNWVIWSYTFYVLLLWGSLKVELRLVAIFTLGLVSLHYQERFVLMLRDSTLNVQIPGQCQCSASLQPSLYSYPCGEDVGRNQDKGGVLWRLYYPFLQLKEDRRIKEHGFSGPDTALVFERWREKGRWMFPLQICSRMKNSSGHHQLKVTRRGYFARYFNMWY